MFNEDAKIRQEIRRLQKAMKKSPLLFARLGECYLRLGDWEQAEKVLTSGVEKHPNYTTGLLVLGEGYLYAGFYRDAEECAKKGLEKHPNHLGILRLMEKVKKKTEEEKDLEQVRTHICTLDPLLTSREEEAIADRWEDSVAEPIAAEPGGKAVEKPSLEIPAEGSAKVEVKALLTEADRLTEKEDRAAQESVVEAEQAEQEAKDLTSVKRSEEQTTSKDPFGLDESPVEEDSRVEESIETPAEDHTEGEETSAPTEEDLKPAAQAVADLETLEEPSEEEGPKTAEPEEEEPARPKKKIATKTLGELYATQKKYDEAIEIYEKLIENDPTNKAYKERLEELKERREAALSQSVDSGDE